MQDYGLQPTSNNTCQYSDEIEDLCNLTEQSPSSQDSKHLTVMIPYNECQFILELLENDLEGFDISSPDGPSTNGTYIQITITKIPNRVVIIIIFMALGVALGIIMASKSNDLIAVGNEAQRPPEPEQQNPPEPEQQSMPRQQLDLETPLN